MIPTCNSSRTNRLLQRVRSQDGVALDELFALHRERLRKMVRLRLDRRLRGQFTSSAVLQQVYTDAGRRIGEYLADPGQPVFLWLRRLTGERIQVLHRQHLGAHFDAGAELSLYRGALPEVNSGALAAQLIGDKPANQALVRADMVIRLQEALNGLDPYDREVLAMCHFEEMRDEEVAAVLAIDKMTATLRYVRALKHLKEILKSIPGFFDPR
jgi:RNA polymerase sigma-70 factor (ECF subfamily)